MDKLFSELLDQLMTRTTRKGLMHWSVKEQKAIQTITHAEERGDTLWLDTLDEFPINLDGEFTLQEIQAVVTIAKKIKRNQCW